MRKSQLAASNEFEIKKLSRSQDGFLNCSIEEERDNLYYDIQGRVMVKARDVYGSDSEYSKKDFLREYKSLIGCTLVIDGASLRSENNEGIMNIINEEAVFFYEGQKTVDEVADSIQRRISIFVSEML